MYVGHVCNLKEFKIYGGLDPNDMKELLHKGILNVCDLMFLLTLFYKGLTDDNKAEAFPIRHTYNNLVSMNINSSIKYTYKKQ